MVTVALLKIVEFVEPLVCIFRLYHCTKYVVSAYCYRPSSTRSDGDNTAESVEMPFGLRTRVGPGNHVLDGGLDPPWEGAILRGKDRPL